MRTVAGSKLLPPFFHLWHLCLCNHSLSSEMLGRQRCKCHVCPGIQSLNTLEPASPAQSSLRKLSSSATITLPLSSPVTHHFTPAPNILTLNTTSSVRG